MAKRIGTILKAGTAKILPKLPPMSKIKAKQNTLMIEPIVHLSVIYLLSQASNSLLQAGHTGRSNARVRFFHPFDLVVEMVSLNLYMVLVTFVPHLRHS
jgi:hypothetical protein